MSAPAFRTATEWSRELEAGRIGARELLELYLDRLERLNPGLNAVVARDLERARRAAGEADEARTRGRRQGPLHGLPVTVKESFSVAGLPTTWGVPRWRDHIATAESAAVRRLREAGAVIFGKTNVPLLLADWQSFNAVYGTTGNPWDVGRTPGGSSGGAAAAVAAGLTVLETGTDIGGSLRNPAHYCGVYTHKPTWGIISMAGHGVPGARSLPDISVAGPIARGVDDLELSLDVLAGAEGEDAIGWQLELPRPHQKRLADYRVALMLDHPASAVDDAVKDRLQAVADALAGAGATLSDRARPAFDGRVAHVNYLRLMRAVTTARLPRADFEGAAARVAALSPDDDGPGALAARIIAQPYRDWHAANEARVHQRAAWAEFFRDWDLLICPCAASAAFPHDQETPREERTIVVNGKPEPYNDQLFWAGYSGSALLPSTVAPAGLTPDGLPVGVQIVGPYLRDRTTIDLARRLADLVGGFTPPPGWD